jgi:5-formaminoimidazole-4-carboxamide-1-beta-D-ribofuranosyl 5'-monophosphate synthetase
MVILKRESESNLFIIFIDENIEKIIEVHPLSDINILDTIEEKLKSRFIGYGNKNIVIDNILAELVTEKVISIPDKSFQKFLVVDIKQYKGAK